MLWYGGLCATLAALSALVVLAPDIPVAIPSRSPSVAVATLAAAVGLALLQLGLLRFQIYGRPLDLCVGLAFGTLALSNLLVRLTALVTGAEPGAPEVSLNLIMLSRVVSGGLFLAGLVAQSRVIDRERRARLAWGAGGATAGALAAVGLPMVLLGERLPAAIGPAGRRLLDQEVRIVDMLPEQSPGLVIVSATVVLLYLVATIGYVRLWRRWADPHLGSLVVALTLLLFSQVFALLFPPAALDYVSVSDGFRMAAYLVLLFSLVARIGGEIAEHAAQDERLRLSRELHDGLAQELSLLNLRLKRAAGHEMADGARQQLEAAVRLGESAMLEARQAITTLRTGQVSWTEFVDAVSSFADEFSLNHDVEIDLAVRGEAGQLPADLQLEILRILQEACSNATRHGEASRIQLAIAALSGELEVQVQDDGRGFEPRAIERSEGVGLRSFRERVGRRGGSFQIDAIPGAGATVQVRIPLPRERQASA